MPKKKKTIVLVTYCSKTSGHCPESLLQTDFTTEKFLKKFSKIFETVAEAYHKTAEHLRRSFS